MQTTVSYGAKILNPDSKALKATRKIYGSALVFMSQAINADWEDISKAVELADCDRAKAIRTVVEAYTHRTKGHPNPKYDFDASFPNFPSYFRRDVIAKAYGAVSSYRSNFKNWEEGGKVGKPPALTANRNEPPCFYRDNMGQFDAVLNGESDCLQLKLYNGTEWKWLEFRLRNQDVKYLAKFWAGIRDEEGAKSCPPTLVIQSIGRKHTSGWQPPAAFAARYPKQTRKHRSHQRNYGTKYYLRFAFERSRDLELNDAPLDNRRILSVDMGVNTDATCVILNGDGTVAGRKFIDFPAEKDRLGKLVGRVRRAQREHGRTGGRQEWARANRCNDDLSRKIATAIVDYAVENKVNTIVFEHLDMKGKTRGRNKQRLHLWRKNGIQEIVTSKAHANLIRISRVCAWGTSKLAYDGSGQVTRGISVDEQAENYSICRFQTGKIYNCDLSAAYNIGARYYLREWRQLMERKILFGKACRRMNLDPVAVRKHLELLPAVPQRTYSHFYVMFHASPA